MEVRDCTSWQTVACGQTQDQVQLTALAKKFIQTRRLSSRSLNLMEEM